MRTPALGTYVETVRPYGAINPLLPSEPLRGWVVSVHDFRPDDDFVSVYVASIRDSGMWRTVIVSPDAPEPFSESPRFLLETP